MSDTLVEKRLKFRRANKKDINFLTEWVRQEDFHHFIDYKEVVLSQEEVEEQIEAQLYQSIIFLPSSFLYVVELGDSPLGMILFHSIDWKSRNAAIEIYIGNRDFRSKGYGKKIFSAACYIAFDEFNLFKVYGYIYSFNLIAIHIAESLSAKKEGALRKAVIKDEKLFDIYIYGMLKNEFTLLLRGRKIVSTNP